MLTKLKIHSVIESLDESGQPFGEPEINSAQVRGNLRRDGNAVHVSYTDNGEGGSGVCHITAYEDGKVAVSQRGKIVSDILFSEGEEQSTVYSIPPYKFDLTVKTERAELSFDGSGIKIELVYIMNLGGQPRRARLSVCTE